MIKIPVSNGSPALIDDEDYDLVKDYRWHNSYGYAGASIRKGDKTTTIKMHRLIIACKPGLVVDHINRNRSDNRRANLREVTHQENAWNRNKNSNNKSGVTGVCWHKLCQKWRVTISTREGRKEIGMYDSLRLATMKRKQAELKYYKDYIPI